MESFFASANEEYLVGNSLTVADVACGFSIGPLDIFERISADKWPKLSNWWKKLNGNQLFRQLNYDCLKELSKNLPEKYRNIYN